MLKDNYFWHIIVYTIRDEKILCTKAEPDELISL